MPRLVVVVALIGLGLGLGARTARGFDRGRTMGLAAAAGGAPFAMLDSRIEVTVRGPILETVVVQRFRNPGDRATEAIYTFPLPPDAAVSAMAIRIGTRTIRAAIERRDAAQRRYEAAVAAGVAAAVLEQERPDVFTQSVAAVPAHGVVEVTLRYDAVARFAAGRWELVVPMVVAPRYVPGTASGRATTGSGRSPDTDRAPDASRVTPAAAPGAGGSTAVAIHFVDAPVDLASPTHELGGTARDATLSDPTSDHDAIVRWRAPVAQAGWIERDGDAGFAAVVVEAPPPAPRPPVIRVVLAIDRAATTRGDGDAVAHPLIRAVLGALTAADRVRLVGAGWTAPGDALRAIEAGWATPGRRGDLTRVLEAAVPDGAAILLVSDGLVADDPAAIAAARRLGVPVHVIGIGPAPARGALHQIAAATGGTVRFAIAGDDLTGLAAAAIADVAAPAPPLAITWGTLAASEVEPQVLPRLGAGQAMLVLARIQRVQAANARSRGEVFAFERLAPGRAVEGATTSHGALARRWARERLGDLLAGPAEPATRHALAYGLVSPGTSLVAIGSEVIVEGGVKRSVSLPVSLPAGMQWRAVKQAIDETRVPVGEAARDQEARQDVAPPVPAPVSAATPAPTAPEDRREEVVTATGSTLDRKSTETNAGDVLQHTSEEISLSGGRGRRLTAALGGGLAFDHGARGLVALHVRFELVRRLQLGAEAALWLVGGTDPEARVLLTVARRLSRSLELGLGAGIQLGDGTGVAGSLRLRAATPIRGLAGFVRYDAALLLTRPTLDGEHAVTLGVEVSY